MSNKLLINLNTVQCVDFTHLSLVYKAEAVMPAFVGFHFCQYTCIDTTTSRNQEHVQQELCKQKWVNGLLISSSEWDLTETLVNNKIISLFNTNPLHYCLNSSNLIMWCNVQMGLFHVCVFFCFVFSHLEFRLSHLLTPKLRDKTVKIWC